MDNLNEDKIYDCDVVVENLIGLLKSNKIKMVDYANAVGYKTQTIYSWRSKKERPDWVDKAFKTFSFLYQIEYFEPMLLFRKDIDINRYKNYETKIIKRVKELKAKEKELEHMKVLFNNFGKLKLNFDQQFIYLVNKIESARRLNNIEDMDKFKQEVGTQLYDCINNALSRKSR